MLPVLSLATITTRLPYFMPPVGVQSSMAAPVTLERFLYILYCPYAVESAGTLCSTASGST